MEKYLIYCSDTAVGLLNATASNLVCLIPNQCQVL